MITFGSKSQYFDDNPAYNQPLQEVTEGKYRNYAKDSCTIFFYFSLFGATQWCFGLIFLPLQHRFGKN